MPDLETIRTAIIAKLEAVANIGLVHNRQRFAAKEEIFRELYIQEAQLLGWHVRRVATREISPNSGRWIGDHDWEIRGYQGFSDVDESELAFDALIEAIRDAFREDETLGGVVFSTVTDRRAGIEVAESLPVMFTGVLCHSCKLLLTTQYLN